MNRNSVIESMQRSKFMSIRWKLISTYLLLILFFVVILNIFIASTLEETYVRNKKVSLLSEANVISNSVKYFIDIPKQNYSFALLSSQIISYGETLNSRVLILDKNGRVLKDSNQIIEGKLLKHDEIKKALGGDTTVESHEFEEFGRVMYLAVPIRLDNKVIGVTFISTSLNDIKKNIEEVQDLINLISLIGLVFISLIGFGFADYLSKPINRMIQAINKMSQGDFSQKIETHSSDEFGLLSSAFNSMSIKLGEVDAQRKDFVANVSHELRTPLSSIKLLSNSLIQDESAGIEIYREFMKDIDGEVERLNNIITDLLLLVDLDKKKLDVNLKPTYVNFLVGRIIKRLRPLAEEKRMSITFIEKDKLQLRLDSDKIQQSIINILHNAIKYTQEEGAIKVEIYKENDFAAIKIEDNGCGIPEDELEFIFERFYRVDKARSRQTGGTGLGLPIAKQIIVLHQGHISVESVVGKGTTFTILLPINS